ncbi:hypothetical protein HMPREF1063_01927 [Phocaeicola dorei CL02T00C15]|jgi:hypothetical protein|uniref:Uncharacterized protein n=1 Tax=Phocaeicola dorei CL02T12C06 TaxID=997876 RepID=I9QRI7_9BACT|nr:hypothetical protein HMPREF1063_01927 [Phocaeicola dorei CL02T00C15]EIY32286.1 hypothetical protein HMPREF1064_02829 [Phocaeicola dorei CL02T12C06]
MSLLAGRKVLCSLDRGGVKSDLLRPSLVLRCLRGRKRLLLSLAKCIFAKVKSFFD